MSFDALVKATTTPPGALAAAELAILDTLTPADSDRFLLEVVMQVADPLLLQTMWFTVTAVVPAAKLEQAMIAALNGSDPRRALNALALGRFVFGMDDGYGPSAAGARQLNEAAERWTHHPQLGVWATGFVVAVPAADMRTEVALAYERIGGGARDHTQKIGAPVKKGNTSSRPLAPLITGAQFAQRMADVGTLDRALTFLPKLARMPEPLRILTLESLWGASGVDDFCFIEEQSAAMLG